MLSNIQLTSAAKKFLVNRKRRLSINIKVYREPEAYRNLPQLWQH